jgi:transposase-like protein
MKCYNCRIEARKFGKHRNGLQRFQCQLCRKTFTEAHERPLDEMRLDIAKAETILKPLVEGVSVRSIKRLTDVHRDTILRLLVLAGERCEKLMGRTIMNVPVKDVQLDEIWGFVGKKQKRLEPGDNPNLGDDAYTFVAIERLSNLVLNFALGKRDQKTTDIFVESLRLATSRQS